MKKHKQKKDKEGSGLIEADWVLRHIRQYQGKVLDFGSGCSAPLARKLVEMSYEVTCIDLMPPKIKPREGLHYIQGDITELALEAKSFGIVINSSSIEHAGLAGRYGSKHEPDQDLTVMQSFKYVLTPGGVQFLTIPVGVDMVIGCRHRVYGEGRLPRLLDGWTILRSQYWCKDEENIYKATDKKTALEEYPTGPEAPRYYALGLYILGVEK